MDLRIVEVNLYFITDDNGRIIEKFRTRREAEERLKELEE